MRDLIVNSQDLQLSVIPCLWVGTPRTGCMGTDPRDRWVPLLGAADTSRPGKHNPTFAEPNQPTRFAGVVPGC